MSFRVAGGDPGKNQLMAWEWVAPVATATASIAVGVGGVFFTWLTGKQGREHAETVLGLQLSHERLLASEARNEQRLEKTYVDLLHLAERAGRCVQLVLPVVVVGQPQPPWPTREERSARAALAEQVTAELADHSQAQVDHGAE